MGPGAIIDLQCNTKWPDETQIGPRVALRNAGNLRSLTADKSTAISVSAKRFERLVFDRSLNTVCSRPTITI